MIQDDEIEEELVSDLAAIDKIFNLCMIVVYNTGH